MVQVINMLQSLSFMVSEKVSREEGQDFAEYAIILALVVLVAALAFGPLGTQIATVVGNVTTQLGGA